MISLARYADLFSQPDLRAAIAASIVGRLPIGLTGLAILLLVQASSNSFASGGIMTAAYIAGLASIAPLAGRAIDRLGPRPVLRACAIAFPAALCLLVLSVHFLDPKGWVSLPLAFIAGASFPPISVCMRTLLRQRLADDAQLSAAYSLEAVLIEMIFIVGPLVVALLIATTVYELPVLLAALCAAGGTALFLRTPALQHWRRPPRVANGWGGPLSAPGFPTLLPIILVYASAFGLVEIGITGYAASVGRTPLAGILLALMSVGSALGGLVYGSRTWRAPLARQFAVALAIMGAGVGLLALTMNAWLFAILSLLAGLVIAPALTIQSLLVAKIASDAHITEAFTWSSTALLSGVGIGMALGGWAIERWGPSATFILAAGAALAAGASALGLRARR